MVGRNLHAMIFGFVVVFICCFSYADSLWCRNGIENSVAYVYWQKRCGTNETACFQSVKCTKIGDTPYRNYEWRCINGRTCSNNTGKWIGRYDNIKGESLHNFCIVPLYGVRRTGCVFEFFVCKGYLGVYRHGCGKLLAHSMASLSKGLNQALMNYTFFYKKLLSEQPSIRQPKI